MDQSIVLRNKNIVGSRAYCPFLGKLSYVLNLLKIVDCPRVAFESCQNSACLNQYICFGQFPITNEIVTDR